MPAKKAAKRKHVATKPAIQPASTQSTAEEIVAHLGDVAQSWAHIDAIANRERSRLGK
jgi:hypothetical protein